MVFLIFPACLLLSGRFVVSLYVCGVLQPAKDVDFLVNCDTTFIGFVFITGHYIMSVGYLMRHIKMVMVF